MKIKNLYWYNSSLFLIKEDDSVCEYKGAYIKDINFHFDKDDSVIVKKIKFDDTPILVSKLFSKKDI